MIFGKLLRNRHDSDLFNDTLYGLGGQRVKVNDAVNQPCREHNDRSLYFTHLAPPQLTGSRWTQNHKKDWTQQASRSGKEPRTIIEQTSKCLSAPTTIQFILVIGRRNSD
jgi:hypothetical protein